MTLRIDGDTRLSQVLEGVPGALDYIVGLNPHDFGRLRNPTMRKYMSSRISLHRVAVMANTPEQQLLAELKYDVWSKMALEWHAERVAEDEWHVFVHRPPEESRLPIKPVVGSEVGRLPDAEIAPRLIALAEQLQTAQALEVGGLGARTLERVRQAVQTALGPEYGWTEQAFDADKLRVRITRLSQN